MIRVALTAAAVAVAGVAVPAEAVIFRQTVSFTATNFTGPTGAPPPPFATLSGSFFVSFDTATSVTDRPVTVVDSLDFPTLGPVVFSYIASSNILRFGGAGSTDLVGTGNDFAFLIFGARMPSPEVASFSYQVAAQPGVLYQATRVTASVSTAPEPGTWAMMIFGFGAIGVSMRRRRLHTVDV